MVPSCLIRLGRSGEPEQRLYAFSSAGGNAFDFRGWRHLLPDSVELLGVQLAGRSSRFSDPPAEDVGAIVDEVLPAVQVDRPFVIFGHSFGGLLAYETAQRLAGRGLAGNLKGLWVSESYPPDAIPFGEPISEREDLLQVVSARFGAIPEVILEVPEMAQIVEQALRADYRALESYRHGHRTMLECDITIVTAYDVGEQPSRPAGWEHQTSGSVIHHAFEGGHFYLRRPDHEASLCRLLAADLVGHRPQVGEEWS